MTDAFFLPDDDLLMATEHTRGPWSPTHQHAGPPCAVLARALENCDRRDGFFFGRISFDILRPVPSPRFAHAPRCCAAGAASSWSKRCSRTPRAPNWSWRGGARRCQSRRFPRRSSPLGGLRVARRMGPPSRSSRPAMTSGTTPRWSTGSSTAASWSPGRPGLDAPRIPFVEGEEPTPLQRVFVVADSGNGVSATLDYRRYMFINTDLTVVLHRLPATEWVLPGCHDLPGADRRGPRRRPALRRKRPDRAGGADAAGPRALTSAGRS